MKQRHCIIVGCIAFAALCFLTLFSQYTDDVTELQGAAVTSTKCTVTPTTYVVVGSDDNYLYAFDADKGCLAWKSSDLGGDIKAKPIIKDSIVYVGTTTDELVAVSLTDGKEQWTADTAKIYGAVAVGDYVYAGDTAGTLGVYEDGEQVLSYTGHNIYTDVQVDNGILYIVDEYLKVGTVRAISATTMTQKWAYSTKSQSLAAPLITSDSLYVPSNENTLYKISKQYGVALWTFKTGKSIRSQPATDETASIVYFGSNDGYFYAVNTKDGKLVWKYPVNSEITATAAVDSSNVYFGAQNKNVYALNKKTGTLVWQAKTNGKIYGGLTVYNDKVYVPSSDKSLYALDATTGKVLWSYATKGVLYASVAIN